MFGQEHQRRARLGETLAPGTARTRSGNRAAPQRVFTVRAESTGVHSVDRLCRGRVNRLLTPPSQNWQLAARLSATDKNMLRSSILRTVDFCSRYAWWV